MAPWRAAQPAAVENNSKADGSRLGHRPQVDEDGQVALVIDEIAQDTSEGLDVGGADRALQGEYHCAAGPADGE